MYKSRAGAYDCGRYVLHIDHVQGDPFASPSRLRFEIKKASHGFPEEYWKTRNRKLALEDQVLRRFNGFLRKMDRGNMGTSQDLSVYATAMAEQEEPRGSLKMNTTRDLPLLLAVRNATFIAVCLPAPGSFEAAATRTFARVDSHIPR